MHILTIDLEDWFHILDHAATSVPEQWVKFDSRVERNTERILQWLALSDQKATFFCLGWIAARYPALVKKIAAQGHEIGCHSMDHQLVYTQSRESFRKDLLTSLQTLEGLTGKKVKTYRAPGFSITGETKWVFEELVECGIENDCSVFPALRNHGGFPGFSSRKPCLISSNGCELKEFPMSYASSGFAKIVFSGGGYFRLMPYPIIKLLMKRSEYVMTYFHPRDFDHGQNVLSSLSWKRRFMSYTGLRGAGRKFEMLLSDFNFIPVESAAAMINWTNAPVVIFE